MTTPYTTGQISLVNGEALVTGIGTGWATSLIIGGTIYVEADGGNALPIAEIASDTEITAAIVWTGPTGTYDYALDRDTAYGQQTVANAQALAEYIQRLNSTTLSAVAGVNAIADTLLLFTGPDTATTIPRSSLTEGGEYDVQVDNLAGRAAYDLRPGPTSTQRGYAVLVADIGDGRAAIYSKRSDAAADWTEAAPITGATGPAGSGVTPRGIYAPATVYAARDLVQFGGSTWIAKIETTGNAPPALPTTENTQWLLFARSGETGIVPRGAYNAGTTYSANDMVLDNGSSWLALQTTTGNAPPTLPTTSNAYWRLVAAKGSDGTGTGDVVGPASSVDNRFALFSGTSGKLLKDGGVTIGNAASRNVGTTSGTVAAGDDIRFSQGGSSQNEAIFALEIADLKGSRLGMKGGVADAFDDETGVDVKTNAVYDATNDWYVPSVSGGTTAGSTTTTGPNNLSRNYTAIDRVYSLPAGTVVQKLGVFSNFAATGKIKIALENSSANFSIVLDVVVNHPGTGWLDVALPTPFTVPATGTYRVGVYFPGSGNAVTTAAAPVSYIINDITGASVGGFTADAGASIGPYPTRYTYGQTAQNMTLQSVAYPLPSVPANGRLVLQTIEFDTAVANTDFVAEFSRDNGTTWTAGNLVLSPYLAVGNYKMYEAQPFSVAGQPSGSAMKWRARTLTNKNIAISGIVSQGA
ncbi:hypothetical protein [Agrobacterium vaccinii]|uniref:hypothetical protein n=1 Tax=Agrobacterium vaccinii TaxID=2735528 RepID=UPI001E318306|nr:hypothetical protein [Agrobacterium vaccinii]UHS56825.1 hypothetical protein HRS00_08430 [Agrobacterium vaccinii]